MYRSLKGCERDHEKKRRKRNTVSSFFKSNPSLRFFSHFHMFSLVLSDLSHVNVGTRFSLSRPLPNTYNAVRPEIHSCSLFDPPTRISWSQCHKGRRYAVSYRMIFNRLIAPYTPSSNSTPSTSAPIQSSIVTACASSCTSLTVSTLTVTTRPTRRMIYSSSSWLFGSLSIPLR